MARILVVDDEANIREMLRVVLGRDGHEVLAADGMAAAVEVLATTRDIEVMLTDLRMQGGDGLQLLSHCRQEHPPINVVVMTAYAAWDTAVEAMRLGAWNFITKPFDNNALRALLRRAVDAYAHAEIARQGGTRAPAINLVGNTPQIQHLQQLIEQIGRTDATALITGESGTGKELVAHGIHYSSLRADGAFMRVNSGALTDTLLESELFGHVKGAFTGAVENRPGLFALADGGTLFLDEIGELPLETQVKLLRVLEVGEYLPVGDTRIRHCDVRVIAATNRDLKRMVEAKTFREDLYYRLAIVGVELPALRDRSDDIPLLAGHLLARNAKRLRRHMSGFTETAIEALCTYAWPGNIRELDNRVQRAITLCSSDEIDADDLFGDLGPTHTSMWRNIAKPRNGSIQRASDSKLPALEPSAAHDSLAADANDHSASLINQIKNGQSIDLQAESMYFERQLLEAALEGCDHNLTEAAKLLGLSFRQIRYKAKTLGLR